MREQLDAQFQAKGADKRVKLEEAMTRKVEALKARAESTAQKRQSGSPRGREPTKEEWMKHHDELEAAMAESLAVGGGPPCAGARAR